MNCSYKGVIIGNILVVKSLIWKETIGQEILKTLR